MKTELTEKSPIEREIKLEIEPEAVREVYNKVSQKYAKSANVPGFRKGLAPLDVIRLRFKEEIQNETLRELLPEKVQEAIEEHDLHPVSEPHLHFDDFENIKVNGSQPLNISIHFEIMPEIPTPEYQGLEIGRRVRPLREGELDAIIDERRQQQASLIPVEGRKSENGDTIIVDLEGTFEDDPDAEPIVANDVEIALGDELIEKSFTENLLGVGEDEEKEFTINYPADFSAPTLAGKTVHYKAKVKSVGTLELPELDDDWAQSLDEGFETLDDLRQKLGKDLETVAKSDADARVRNDLIAKLIENHEFQVPNALIDGQARNLLNNFAQDLAQRGMDLNKVEKDFVQMAYNQMRVQAERDVRGAMLLEKIADLEKVEVTEEEVVAEIDRLAEYYNVPAEEIRKSLTTQGGEANIANNLRTRRAIEALVDKAKIRDEEWVDENQAEPVQEKEEEKEKKPKKEKKEPAAEKPQKKAAKKDK